MLRAPALLLVLVLSAGIASAAGEFGVGWSYAYAPVRYRLGHSPDASASGVSISFAMARPTGRTRVIKEAWIRIGAEFAGGDWQISVGQQNAPPAMTWTQQLTPSSWNRLAFPTPITTDGKLEIRVESFGGEAELIGLYTGQGEPDPYWGEGAAFGDDDRVYPNNLWLFTDAGGAGSFAAASIVIVYGDDVDRFAAASCDAGLEAVGGNPYIDRLEITVPEGAFVDQTFARIIPPNRQPSETALSSFWMGGAYGSPKLGATILDRGMAVSEMEMNLPGSWFSGGAPCVVMPPDSGTDYVIRFRPIGDGGVVLQAVTAGEELDACHPVARATFGSTRSALVGHPATDLMFGGYVTFAKAGYLDGDGDYYGKNSTFGWYCGGRTDVVTNGNDCDDARYDVRPNGSELCDGIDQNCNGIIDDDVTDAPRCEKFQGVCSGAMKPASLCIDGGWAACGPTEYGPLYESPEPIACDGVDNDCDGTIAQKHRCERQLGPCRGKFVDVCFLEDGACKPSDYGPWFEDVERTCDGIDNDCDGETDGLDPDLPAPSCTLQQGVCAGSHASSAACTDAGWAECSAADYGSDYEAVETRCDGLDNDCDGLTDEACLAAPPSARKPCGCDSTTALTPIALAAIARMLRARSRGHNRFH